MAYSEAVAERIRTAFRGNTSVSEKKMFGGIAFMINGNMSVGVLDDILVLRLGEERAAEALKKPYTKLMDFTGKPMKSMLYVLPEGFATEKDLKQWMDRAIEFALTLPPK